MSRMTDGRLDALKRKFHFDELSTSDMKELVEALVAERAEVGRLRARLDVLDRQRWCHAPRHIACGSGGWAIEVPDTREAAEDRVLRCPQCVAAEKETAP